MKLTKKQTGKQLDEKEIDNIVESQADDDSAWEKLIKVRRARDRSRAPRHPPAGKDGLSLARHLRERYQMGMGMVTSVGTVVDRISSPARRFLARPVERLVGHITCEISNRHMAIYGYRLTKCLDTLNLVHGLSREIRFTTMGT